MSTGKAASGAAIGGRKKWAKKLVAVGEIDN